MLSLQGVLGLSLGGDPRARAAPTGVSCCCLRGGTSALSPKGGPRAVPTGGSWGCPYGVTPGLSPRGCLGSLPTGGPVPTPCLSPQPPQPRTPLKTIYSEVGAGLAQPQA